MRLNPIIAFPCKKRKSTLQCKLYVCTDNFQARAWLGHYGKYVGPMHLGKVNILDRFRTVPYKNFNMPMRKLLFFRSLIYIRHKATHSLQETQISIILELRLLKITSVQYALTILMIIYTFHTSGDLKIKSIYF